MNRPRTAAAAPFDHAQAAQAADQIDTYLTGHGYTITPDPKDTPMRTPARRATCDASRTTPAGYLGPCILRHRHAGPIHRDATGATWYTRHTAPSRADVAFTAFLTVTCLIGTLAAAAVHHAWGWTTIGAAGVCVLGRELAYDVADYRRQRSRT